MLLEPSILLDGLATSLELTKLGADLRAEGAIESAGVLGADDSEESSEIGGGILTTRAGAASRLGLRERRGVGLLSGGKQVSNAS